MGQLAAGGHPQHHGTAAVHRLPSDTVSERALLAILLHHRESVVELADWFDRQWWSLESHRWVYDALLTCIKEHRGVTPDLPMLASVLRRQPVGEGTQLDVLGGMSRLMELAESVGNNENLMVYATAVRDAAVRRAVIEAGGGISALGYDEKTPVSETLDTATAYLRRLQHGASTDGLRPLSETFHPYLDDTKERVAQTEPDTRLETPFSDLNTILGGGFRRGALSVVAARTRIGKSVFALNVATHTFMRGRSVGYFTLEMSREQLALRLLVSQSADKHLTLHELERGTWFCDEERSQVILDDIGYLSEFPFYLDDATSLTLSQMATRIERVQEKVGGLDLVVVDYMQLMTPPPKETGRERQVAAIAEGLRKLARDYKTTVLGVAQLNRAVDHRQVKQPQLSDLRESGAIEQEADVILLLNREEVYNPETPNKGIMDIVVAKNRSGIADKTVSVRFVGKRMLLQDVATERMVAGY